MELALSGSGSVILKVEREPQVVGGSVSAESGFLSDSSLAACPAAWPSLTLPFFPAICLQACQARSFSQEHCLCFLAVVNLGQA